MTSTRLVRGTKIRILLYIIAFLIVSGLLICFNSAFTQLEDIKKSNEICHQQEENLSTQLQVISDYKQRLEKSLKTEKIEHQQTKNELENKLNEIKDKNERATNEANLRFSSLQQHFNLLQTQNEDLNESCSKTNSKHLNEMNNLQMKVNEIQEELKKLNMARNNLKEQYSQLQQNNFNLKRTNDLLKKELNDLNNKCPTISSSLQSLLNISDKSINNGQQELSVLAAPYYDKPQNNNQISSTKNNKPTTAKTKPIIRIAIPLGIPNITPKDINNNKLKLINFKNNNENEGILPIPIDQSVYQQMIASNQNDTINSRYQNKIEDEIKNNNNNNNNDEIEERKVLSPPFQNEDLSFKENNNGGDGGGGGGEDNKNKISNREDNNLLALVDKSNDNNKHKIYNGEDANILEEDDDDPDDGVYDPIERH